ncbi:hypothetical protein [Coleofasciculus sp. FACHB-SPT9]|uniref:hypothetical protein n=1 Tax=Coleofasciculus sp. FACHB-SPT9 TaxID=2692791 RepID=UPI001684A482|nr:hypothetical protein [Coleofasciculus sp. FACHB-SPT9]MBD1893056.1 hypothetical protein [Coleofasciculus sp. FACHB-SPT9]
MRPNQRIDPNQNEGLVKVAQLYSVSRVEFVYRALNAYSSSLNFTQTQSDPAVQTTESATQKRGYQKKENAKPCLLLQQQHFTRLNTRA